MVIKILTLSTLFGMLLSVPIEDSPPKDKRACVVIKCLNSDGKKDSSEEATHVNRRVIEKHDKECDIKGNCGIEVITEDGDDDTKSTETKDPSDKNDRTVAKFNSMYELDQINNKWLENENNRINQFSQSPVNSEYGLDNVVHINTRAGINSQNSQAIEKNTPTKFVNHNCMTPGNDAYNFNPHCSIIGFEEMDDTSENQMDADEIALYDLGNKRQQTGKQSSQQMTCNPNIGVPHKATYHNGNAGLHPFRNNGLVAFDISGSKPINVICYPFEDASTKVGYRPENYGQHFQDTIVPTFISDKYAAKNKFGNEQTSLSSSTITAGSRYNSAKPFLYAIAPQNTLNSIKQKQPYVSIISNNNILDKSKFNYDQPLKSSNIHDSTLCGIGQGVSSSFCYPTSDGQTKWNSLKTNDPTKIGSINSMTPIIQAHGQMHGYGHQLSEGGHNQHASPNFHHHEFCACEG